MRYSAATMQVPAPAIYVRLEGSPRLRWMERALALAIALAAIAVLFTAAWLTPAGQGVGTHTALGFQPCSFLQRTGLPCAGCGMTTSFSHFVRGNWFTSFVTQPFGFVLALATAATFWSGLYLAITGKPSHRLLRMIPMKAHLFFWIPFAVFGWVWKIVLIVLAR